MDASNSVALDAVGVDVGNTRIKLYPIALASPKATQDFHSRLSTECRSPEKLLELVTEAWGQLPKRWHVVSVDPSFASGFKRIAGARERDVVVWNADHPLPISHPYAQAEKLGVDRLLGALAAHHLHPQVDVIVVDAGTAVTVDVVCADGTFAGGAIAPGLLSLSESLARSGRQLPRVDPLQRADYPGVSTDACLSVGIRAAFDGALTQLVSAALESVPNAVIVVTGGDGAAAAEALQDHDVEQVPALIHIGFHELESHLAAEE